MKIEIKNCNNIDNGNIEIEQNKLNIKYAINGTGKSTISKALHFSANDKLNGTKTLSSLTPFKCIGKEDSIPEIIGDDSIANIKIFDEDYISEFVFMPDELLKGSFDIFIRDEEYEKGIKEIDNLIEKLKEMFSENQDIDDLINDFNELSGSFGKPTKKGIHGSSILSKAFKNGNKVVNIPKGLEEYSDFIKHNENYKWIKWQIDGKSFNDINGNCPYCISEIESKRGRINKISEEYDPKIIQSLNKIIAVFDRLNQYFSEETKSVIKNFIKNIEGYSDEQIGYLREVKEQIDRLNQKFVNAKNIGFKSLKDVDKVLMVLKEYKIDLNLYIHLNSENTKKKATIVNDSIEGLLIKAGELQGIVSKQKEHIENLIRDNKIGINGFLKNAGYEYSVDIVEDDNNQYKLKLIHKDKISEVKDVKSHLSFGERNAFSLVLFMYDALKNDLDLIILDDPISSFDKNKKYAIIDMLFRREKSFKGKTVLLLTHDFEPIIDMVHHHRDKFIIPNASFLENTHCKLTEKIIHRSDIKTFIEINKENIFALENNVNKLVYLRRLYEITENKGCGYHLISNLMHKRDVPLFCDISGSREMTKEEVEDGKREILETIDNFDYSLLLKTIQNDAEMINIYSKSDNNYEKLHVHRMLFEGKVDKSNSDIIQKFINQAFHIENDFIYQLNPRKYQMVPQFVIDECDIMINRISENN